MEDDLRLRPFEDAGHRILVGYLLDVQLGARLTPTLTLTGELQRSRDTDVKYDETLPASFEFPLSAATTDTVRAIQGLVPNVVAVLRDLREPLCVQCVRLGGANEGVHEPKRTHQHEHHTRR